MEINQIASMIEWLDEERRRDKALIATLEERVALQGDSVDTMQRRVNISRVRPDHDPAGGVTHAKGT